MKVTDKQFYMESKLIDKLNLMCDKMTKVTDDNLVLIDGDEGAGKSTLASEVCYYVADKTGRSFTVDDIYFDLDKLIDIALKTKEKIFDWDEGALGGLSIEWWKKNQLKFLKLLMVARKRKHFFVICIPKFFKLNEYLVVDRSIALLHVYKRNEIQKGRFVYFSKSRKEALWQNWKKTKWRNYKRYFNFHGSFPDAFSKIINIEEYDKKKDTAILSIGKEETKVNARQAVRNAILYTIVRIKQHNFPIQVKDLPMLFNITERTARRLSIEANKLVGKPTPLSFEPRTYAHTFNTLSKKPISDT